MAFLLTDIYMFGLGPDVERELLTEYMTDNAGKHVFLMDDLEQLHEVFDQMIGIAFLPRRHVFV